MSTSQYLMTEHIAPSLLELIRTDDVNPCDFLSNLTINQALCISWSSFRSPNPAFINSLLVGLKNPPANAKEHGSTPGPEEDPTCC